MNGRINRWMVYTIKPVVVKSWDPVCDRIIKMIIKV